MKKLIIVALCYIIGGSSLIGQSENQEIDFMDLSQKISLGEDLTKTIELASSTLFLVQLDNDISSWSISLTNDNVTVDLFAEDWSINEVRAGDTALIEVNHAFSDRLNDNQDKGLWKLDEKGDAIDIINNEQLAAEFLQAGEKLKQEVLDELIALYY